MQRRQEDSQSSLVDLRCTQGSEKECKDTHLVNGIPHVQFTLLLVLIFLIFHVDIHIASGAQLLMLRGKNTHSLSASRPRFGISEPISVHSHQPARKHLSAACASGPLHCLVSLPGSSLTLALCSVSPPQVRFPGPCGLHRAPALLPTPVTI